MTYEYTVEGAEVDWEPIEAANIHEAARMVRQILAEQSVWPYDTETFTANVNIRSANGDATVSMPVECCIGPKESIVCTTCVDRLQDAGMLASWKLYRSLVPVPEKCEQCEGNLVEGEIYAVVIEL